MPNLAGMLDMRARPSDTAAAVALLSRVLDVPGVDYTLRSWSDERFAAVNLLNGICGNLDQPATTGETVLFLDGEVYNLTEIWIEKLDGGAVPSPARACLDLYQHYGNGFATRLNGQFNIVLYDKATHSVRVFNDRLAYRPFYYWSADGLALFGLEKKAIFAALGRTPPLDSMGTLEFFTFGHNLDDRTVFSGVRVMPPASVLEFNGNRVGVRQYWQLSYDRQSRVGSANESAIEFGHRLCRAVTRRVGETRRYGIFLSGGLDSRAAAGALSRACSDVASFTFGDDDSPDLKYGRQLADVLGFASHRLLYDDVSFAELLPKVVWRTEGSIPFHQTLSIAHHRYIRAEAHVIFNGHFGDALTGGHLLPGQFLARDTGALVKHILAKRTMLRLPTLQSLFKPSFLEDAHREMVQGLERTISALQDVRFPLACNLWDMRVRQTRFTFSAPAVDRHAVEQVTPFTDNDVVDWMLSMPLRHLLGQRVYKRMVVWTFPEMAGVPWARTERRISTSAVIDSAAQVGLFAAKRLRRMRRHQGEDAVDPRLRTLETYVGGDLFDTLPRDLFDAAGVRRTARAALNGSGSSTPLFLATTLAECLRLFGAGALVDPPMETQPVL